MIQQMIQQIHTYLMAGFVNWRRPNSIDSHSFPIMAMAGKPILRIWQANKPTTSPAESHPIAVAQPSALASVKKQSRSWTL